MSDETIIYILFFWVLLSLIIGAWSRRKGGSFIAGFVFSLVLSPIVAGLITAVRKPITGEIERRELRSGAMKKCPHCAELIRREATKCRFCGEDLVAQSAAPLPAPPPAPAAVAPVPEPGLPAPQETAAGPSIPCPLCGKRLTLSTLKQGENWCPHCFGKFVAA
jgi:hypothetical protein